MSYIYIPEVEDYILYMKEHPAWINKLRTLLIKNVVIPTLSRDDIYFDRKMFNNCIAYCEKNYYKLFPYQKFVYAFVFLYDKASGNPVFGKFLIVMGRGNGKDGFIVPLANFLQTPLHGVRNYNIDIAANSEDQAHDTFDVAYDMLTTDGRVKPKFKGKFSVTKSNITNIATNSRMKYNTSNASTKDGKKIGCLILNEIHAYEDYGQINVFESAFGKIPARREFIITTSGYVREGPYDDYIKVAVEILETGENRLRLFPFVCRLDSDKEVDDITDAIHKANPSMEYMPNLELEIKEAYYEMLKFPSKRPEYLTKRCNLPASNEEAAVTSWKNILRCCYEGTEEEDLEKKIPRKVPDTKGKPAVIAIDYADIRDFASAGVLTFSDPEYIWQQHTWIGRRSPTFDSIRFPFANYGQPGFNDFEIVDDPVLPVREIVGWCIDRMKEYDVKKIVLDTYRYTLFKQEFQEYGLTIESKENPGGIVRLIRKIGSATTIIAPFIEQEFELGHINYGDSAIMRWYTNNTCIITDKFGNKQFGKIEPKLRKNDGFMAMDAAMFTKDELEEVVYYV